MDNHALEATLIGALNILQHVELDKAFLGNQHTQNPELVTEQYFAFRIADIGFVVKADCFCEVFVNIPIAPLPNAPALLMGLCNIRSTLVPVYQLHARFNRDLPPKKIVLCIGKGDKSVAVLINELPTSIALGQQHLIADSNDQEDLRKLLMVRSYSFQKTLYHLLDGATLGEQLVTLAATEKLSHGAGHYPRYIEPGAGRPI